MIIQEKDRDEFQDFGYVKKVDLYPIVRCNQVSALLCQVN